MSDSNLIILVLLAATAGFLLLRLRSILGTRQGFEDPSKYRRAARPEPTPGSDGDNVVALPRRLDDDDDDIFAVAEPDSDLGRSLKAIKDADPSFDVRAFIEGSKAAYEMLLSAFELGDKETMRPYLSADVFTAFESAIDERASNGLSVEMRFIGFRSAEPIEAAYSDATRVAEITMRFVSEILTTTRNTAGEIVDGDPKVVQKVTEIWTFARNVDADTPDWKLVATGG